MHNHEWETLWDAEKNRLFAFCTSGGIAECQAEMELDEIDRRLNAVERLPPHEAIATALAIENGLAGRLASDGLRAYAVQLEAE